MTINSSNPELVERLRRDIAFFRERTYDIDHTEQARITRIEQAADAILTLSRENDRLRDHIAEQITFAESRIQDGRDMGASIWRIALEDVARENRDVLAASQDSGV